MGLAASSMEQARKTKTGKWCRASKVRAGKTDDVSDTVARLSGTNVAFRSDVIGLRALSFLSSEPDGHGFKSLCRSAATNPALRIRRPLPANKIDNAPDAFHGVILPKRQSQPPTSAIEPRRASVSRLHDIPQIDCEPSANPSTNSCTSRPLSQRHPVLPGKHSELDEMPPRTERLRAVPPKIRALFKQA